MVATPNTPSDSNVLLVQLCVKVLSNVAPEGMTTKELAAELDKEIVPGFSGISSSILSSKLNAVFRRSHNDSHTPSNEQLAELPLTRSQSSEVPRRLVYRYSPPEQNDANNDKSHEESESESELESITEPAEIKVQKPQTDDSSTNNRNMHSKDSMTSTERSNSASNVKVDSEVATPDDEVSSSDDPSEPLTPKEEHTDSQSWPSAKRRKMSSKLGQHDDLRNSVNVKNINGGAKDSSDSLECPHTPPSSGTTAARKAQALFKSQQPTPKFNLYYDAVGFEAVSAALCPVNPVESSKPQDDTSQESVIMPVANGGEFDSETWSDYVSPESLGLSDLDTLVC